MAHEILSVKLHEMDNKISRIYSRIQMSESVSHETLSQETAALRQECAENDEMLRTRIKFSKNKAVAASAEIYEQIENLARQAQENILQQEDEAIEYADTERKLLFAEYSLDFAMQAVDHALLISLEAIDDVMTQEEREANH